MNRMSLVVGLLLVFGSLACLQDKAHGQMFGVELHNTTMPASAGMGGASIARPQDLTSAVNANPASLTQFRGTQFLFGGTWIEPTFNLGHAAAGLPMQIFESAQIQGRR